MTASISGLTITGGSISGDGAGLSNYGALNLSDCVVSSNATDYFHSGGGLYNVGNATMTDCTVSGNSAGTGGGLANDKGTMTLTDCRSWSAATHVATTGGGLANDRGITMTLTDCMVSDNQGGGFDTGGDGGRPVAIMTVLATRWTDCTVSGNNVGYETGAGAGLESNGGTVNLTNCTISGNTAEFKGSVAGLGCDNSGTVNLTNCTVSNNITPQIRRRPEQWCAASRRA